MSHKTPNHVLVAITSLITIAIISILLFSLFPIIKDKIKPELVNLIALSLSEKELQELKIEALSDISHFWENIPEPLVNRIGQRGYSGISKKAVININNAGMRCKSDYLPKEKSSFRIVCLGDSFVFGTAGREEDRFCDQIEEYYQNSNITVENKSIETLSLGISGWNAVQEVNYLASRISDYAPDIIIILAIPNDITDSHGITGNGALTNTFTNEHRDLGSAVFSNVLGRKFGLRQRTALETTLSTEGEKHWDKAMQGLARLTALQKKLGGKCLISILDWTGQRDTEFVEEYIVQLNKYKINSPYVITSFFPSKTTRLPHDGHPSRLGHKIMADHFITFLNNLQWIPVDISRLPEVDKRLSLEISPHPKVDLLNQLYQEKIQSYLFSSIDFRKLSKDNAWGFLGGTFPEKNGHDALVAPPWASIKSGFLLKNLTTQTPQSIELTISIPNHLELYPFNLKIRVNGQHITNYNVAEPPREQKEHTIVINIPAKERQQEIFEVILETKSYFCKIDDHRMKSFQLLSAKVLAETTYKTSN